MIVKNEAALLGRCLSSIESVADEIIVVDTGSTDTTVDIARNAGAVVVTAEWRDDFAAARNISIDNARGAWILWLDADDIVPPSTLPLITELKRKPADRVYGFIVRNERPGNTGTEFNQARMFPNRPDIRFERRIHEQIMPGALRAGLVLEQCNGVIEHHGYAEPGLLRKKAERNARLLLEEYASGTPDAVTAIEIADSFTLIDNEEEAARWYRYVLALPDARRDSPVLAGHALYGLGVMENKHSNFSSAITFFLEALELAPWRTDVLYSLAVAEELNGNTSGAITALQKIFTISPHAGQVGVDFRAASIKAYLRLGRLFMENGRINDALRLVREGTDRVPDRPELHSLSGKVFLKAGMLMEALHAFERSIRNRREGNIEAYIGLCLTYRRAGREEVVGRTLQSIAGMFSADSRFFVAVKILTGKWPVGSMGVPDKEYEEINEALSRNFFGTF